ncbi:beta-L-arabinofuranosidase domain-containing protein [Nesterenkonia massiliensis]|uniref:beta-L-arabinofuranosidase domain-containing protein n=1 Tax=Nesterenkonia massiliensis TaxID=1232429 RepID=UPI0013159C7B|nr:beta-L-arabinofuranosidase domain-containing protein [Nesterenkonia massiliensis]
MFATPESACLVGVPLAQAVMDTYGIFAPAREKMLHLAQVYPVDRILAVFRANAGLDARGAEPPGGWEDWGHPNEQAWGERDYPGRDQAQTANLLRGHYAGHFLSMLALAYAGTQDQHLKTKVDDVVDGLAQCQQALATTDRYSHPGFLASYGEWQFARLEHLAPYGEIWAPYYTAHKIMAGLLDAYELAGNQQALSVLTGMADWVHYRLHKLTPERRQQMWSLYIAGEFGGMNETLARLAKITGRPEHLAAAQFFDQTELLEACARGEDVLDGKHANQHIPQFIGYLHEYDLTGDQRYFDAAVGLFAMVVPGRTYAHGGSGESELWGPPNTQAGDIGRRNAETCVAYNMIKLARELFMRIADPIYTDYIEQALTNQILGSRKNADSASNPSGSTHSDSIPSDTSPEVTYMFPVHPGARREYGNTGTCCGGTGLENHVKYQDSIFFTAPNQTWINLYSPAQLSAEANGIGLRIEGDYPYSIQVRIVVDAVHERTPDHTLHLRIPGWLAPASSAQESPVVKVNGQRSDLTPEPGTYLSLTRDWQPGDVVDLHLPMRLRAIPTIDDPSVQHLQIGPVVLAAISDQQSSLQLPLLGLRALDGSLIPDTPTGGGEGSTANTEEMLKQLRRTGSLDFAGLQWEPVHSGNEASYHMYVTAADDTIAFAGKDSGVPNRLRPNGQTVLESLWADGGFSSRHGFLERTADVVTAAREEGVLSATEAETVLITAATAPLDAAHLNAAPLNSPGHSAPPARTSSTVQGTGQRVTFEDSAECESVERKPAIHDLADHEPTNHKPVEHVTWHLPVHWHQITAPPLVSISITGHVSPTGWHTEHPQITLTAEQLSNSTDQDLQLEYQVDDGAWNTYRAPFILEVEGVHRLRARVTTAEGTANLAEARLQIDTTAPVTAHQVLINGSGAEIRLRAEDSVSGVERVQWEGPGTFWATYQGPFMRALTETKQIIEFAATDVAGNEEPRRQIILPAHQPEGDHR